MIEEAQTPPQALPHEVLAFAAEQGADVYLPAVLEMTLRVFPRATLTLMVEDDPEIANDRHIVLLVKSRDLTVAQALEARWHWHRELFASCPAYLVWVFRLALEGVR